MRSGNRLNPVVFAQAIPLLFRHPSIVVAPLAAAIFAILVGQLAVVASDPVGGLGLGLFGYLVQMLQAAAFGVAIIQANNILNGHDGSFDAAWTEARRKLSSIFLGAVGLVLLVTVAQDIGGYFGTFGILVPLAAVFFLIYVMPAASVDGIVAGYAIQTSYRAAFANPIPSLMLFIAFVVCVAFLPGYVVLLAPWIPALVLQLIGAIFEAVLFAYLAFPFAKYYADVA